MRFSLAKVGGIRKKTRWCRAASGGVFQGVFRPAGRFGQGLGFAGAGMGTGGPCPHVAAHDADLCHYGRRFRERWLSGRKRRS